MCNRSQKPTEQARRILRRRAESIYTLGDRALHIQEEHRRVGEAGGRVRRSAFWTLMRSIENPAKPARGAPRHRARIGLGRESEPQARFAQTAPEVEVRSWPSRAARPGLSSSRGGPGLGRPKTERSTRCEEPTKVLASRRNGQHLATQASSYKVVESKNTLADNLSSAKFKQSVVASHQKLAKPGTQSTRARPNHS